MNGLIFFRMDRVSKENLDNKMIAIGVSQANQRKKRIFKSQKETNSNSNPLES